tara:strand:- start:42 stop:341 length:300 start_codon:yes stop_codon:yes gene_type:complete
MKSKGYSKGGTKMMKAKKGKMMKAKTGKMMKAMGGKMAKGYSKGGTKMMKAKVGAIAGGLGRFTVADLRKAAKMSGYNMVKATTKKTPPGPALFTKKKK